MFHDGNLSLDNFLINILGGISYWFTSALAIAQIILLTLLLLVFKSKNIWIYIATTFLLFILGITLNMNNTSTEATAYFPWFYKTGLEYTFIMAIGGVYARYEQKIDRIMKSYGLFVVSIAYLILLTSTWNTTSLKMLGVGGQINVMGFITMLCGIVIVISLCKKTPFIKWISYIGRYSITFYFFCGMLPAVTGKIANMIFPNRMYAITIIVAGCSIFGGFLITKFINKYLPFMIDLRNIKQWKTKD